MSSQPPVQPRQLPRGRHGLPREVVVGQQRRRMFDATAAVAREKGFLTMTVEDIAAGAGVSRRTFYENFRDKTDCFLATYDDSAQTLLATVNDAASQAGDWEERVRLALEATLRFFAGDPDRAHVGVIEVLAAGPQALERRDAAVRALTRLIASDAAIADEAPPPALLAESIAGGISQLIYGEVLHGRTAQLEGLLPQCMYLVLAPMIGPLDASKRAGLAVAA